MTLLPVWSAVETNMAHCLGEEDGPLETQGAGDQGVLRRCRGRPRLTDSDRTQRRLESRKKYDVRRVYLGESHKLWSELRRRTSLSDAGLAEYLILLNTRYRDTCCLHTVQCTLFVVLFQMFCITERRSQEKVQEDSREVSVWCCDVSMLPGCSCA